jgi:hypothetical protein
VVGSVGYILHTGKPSKAAAGAGLFMGVILGVGSALRSMS